MRKAILSKWTQKASWYSHFGIWQNRLPTKAEQKRYGRTVYNYQRMTYHIDTEIVSAKNHAEKHLSEPNS